MRANAVATRGGRGGQLVRGEIAPEVNAGARIGGVQVASPAQTRGSTLRFQLTWNLATDRSAAEDPRPCWAVSGRAPFT